MHSSTSSAAAIAIDLSLRSSSLIPPSSHGILKPIPRQSWATLWYRTIWPSPFAQPQQLQWSPSNTNTKIAGEYTQENSVATLQNFDDIYVDDFSTDSHSQRIVGRFGRKQAIEDSNKEFNYMKLFNENEFNCEGRHSSVDIAACDGPVHFERISNPNFALTVQHYPDPIPITTTTTSSLSSLSSSSGTTATTAETKVTKSKKPSSSNSNNKNLKIRSTKAQTSNNSKSLALSLSLSPPSSKNNKIYTCIYCHQNFKSLFCYQKHKKRHINPVSVDVSGSNNNILSENIIKSQSCSAKYLNVQFFPCKICGSKFPSYYFVHKHIKNCH